jgi:transposase
MNVIPEAQQRQQYPLPVSSAQHPPAPAPAPVCMDLVPAAAAASTATAPSSQDPSVTKEQLKDHLRQWVRVENEISTLSAEIKKRKLIHQQLSASLLRVMKENEIDCFDIANGRIVYSKTKTRAPLNNGQLKSALKTYYKEDDEKANSLAEFLIASRVEKTRETIKMKIPKIK